MRGETLELNGSVRAQVGGAFIQLPNGITHYELANPESAETVVLVHGFSVPYFIYDPTFAFLTQQGFRVLRFDLFGRGFSDRPRARYDLDFFVDQLRDLMDALRITRNANLIGLSMGGIIASAFTLRHPERVGRLVLIDPAGAAAVALTPMLKAAKLPLVPEAVLGVAGSGFLIQNAAKDFFDPSLVEHFIARYRVQLQYKGFGRAILSTIRNGMLDSFIHVYEALGKLDQDVLLLWGRNDVTTPFAQNEILLKALPRVEFHPIENCGHIPHYEKPEIVNPLLLKFLR
jgi:pimeloyl-ACP methyl ester carboxylesterase